MFVSHIIIFGCGQAYPHNFTCRGDDMANFLMTFFVYIICTLLNYYLDRLPKKQTSIIDWGFLKDILAFPFYWRDIDIRQKCHIILFLVNGK